MSIASELKDLSEARRIVTLMEAEIEALRQRVQKLERANGLLQQHYHAAWNRGHRIGLGSAASVTEKFEDTKNRYMDENQNLTNLLLETEEKLSESQAREAKLREALAIAEKAVSPKAVDAGRWKNGVSPWYLNDMFREVLTIPADDTALKEYRKQVLMDAAEKMEQQHMWITSVAASALIRRMAEES